MSSPRGPERERSSSKSSQGSIPSSRSRPAGSKTPLFTWVTNPLPLLRAIPVVRNERTLPGGLLVPAGKSLKASTDVVSLSTISRDFSGRVSTAGTAPWSRSSTSSGLAWLDSWGLRQNAAWMGPWKLMLFGGGGSLMKDFEKALDVVGHELTHAVIDSTSKLEYEGESGALNEHFADVFGVTVEAAYENPEHPYRIGDTVMGPWLRKRGHALRDMMEPQKEPSLSRETRARSQRSSARDARQPRKTTGAAFTS